MQGSVVANAAPHSFRREKCTYRGQSLDESMVNQLECAADALGFHHFAVKQLSQCENWPNTGATVSVVAQPVQRGGFAHRDIGRDSCLFGREIGRSAGH